MFQPNHDTVPRQQYPDDILLLNQPANQAQAQTFPWQCTKDTTRPSVHPLKYHFPQPCKQALARSAGVYNHRKVTKQMPVISRSAPLSPTPSVVYSYYLPRPTPTPSVLSHPHIPCCATKPDFSPLHLQHCHLPLISSALEQTTPLPALPCLPACLSI